MTNPPMNHPLMAYAGHAWALTREALSMITAQAAAPSPGYSIESQSPDTFEIRIVDGIAVIPVNGVMANDHGWTGYFSGTEYAGYKGVRQRVEKALADPSVTGILLNINSPGGTVSGCKECADFLKNAAQVKPLYAWAAGQMTSGAYWLASAAREIAAPETALIGSIGVVTLHSDWSVANDQAGVKYTYITAGAYKAAGNSDEPLTGDNLAYLQERIDLLYSIFVNAVALNRNLNPDQVSALEAKVLLAGPARDAGLIDRIEPDIDAFIQTLTRKEQTPMDAATLKTNHPDTYAQIKAEGVTEAKAVIDSAVTAAVSSTLGLVKVIAGDEIGIKIEALSKAGITADQAVALKDALGVTPPANQSGGDDTTSRKEILDALKSSSARPVAQGAGDVKDPDFDTLVTAHMTAASCTKGEAMMAMQSKHPEAHKAWLKQKNVK